MSSFCVKLWSINRFCVHWPAFHHTIVQRDGLDHLVFAIFWQTEWVQNFTAANDRAPIQCYVREWYIWPGHIPTPGLRNLDARPAMRFTSHRGQPAGRASHRQGQPGGRASHRQVPRYDVHC